MFCFDRFFNCCCDLFQCNLFLFLLFMLHQSCVSFESISGMHLSLVEFIDLYWNLIWLRISVIRIVSDTGEFCSYSCFIRWLNIDLMNMSSSIFCDSIDLGALLIFASLQRRVPIHSVHCTINHSSDLWQNIVFLMASLFAFF